MICRIHGTLEDIYGGKARIAVEGGLTYEVLLPGFVEARLGASIGQPITLHTVHYLEGVAQGSTFTPRLAGFLSDADRHFYELFTTVKGIGPRKALRCMSLATGQIAGAIADRDLKLLQSLPEIGKRMAETIVTTLHGKVDGFVDSAVYGAQPGEPADSEAAITTGPARTIAREALDVLTQLGDNRTDAVQLIDRALAHHPDMGSTDELIAEVFRIKSGG